MNWSGVFPAVTTQFRDDESIDFESTQRLIARQVEEGVHGIVALGTCGENCSLSASEKRDVLRALREVTAGRVPLVAGVAEPSTRMAIDYVRDGDAIGVDGYMVLPAVVYKASRYEAMQHFRRVAQATERPIMIYNNPKSYDVDVTVDMLMELAELPNVVSVKEASEDTRRVTDLINAGGDRYAIFAGVDDFLLETVMLGAVGWVSGFTGAFPRESVRLFELAREGRYEEAKALYRWFMPLLHLDSIPSLVQCIKLVSSMVGRGTEHARAPRLPLVGEERARVIAITEKALATRPTL
jgi:4-hydroxy-tetrahydrodipicolinate synthase